jgi:type II secretory pathway component GspD/PulD (secretin)
MKRLLALLLLLSAGLLTAEPMKSMEFRDQTIRDILLTLGELNNVSIVPDETVDGRASYVFSNMEFQQALQVFLDTYKLSYSLNNGVYLVSRVSVQPHANGTLDVSATDVPLKSILRVISSKIGKTILYDNLPGDPFTINVTNAKIDDVLRIAIAKYPDFTLDIKDQYYYLRNKAQGTTAVAAGDSGALVQDGDRFSFHVEKSRFKDLLVSLFSKAQKQFVLLLDRDMVVENLYLKDLSFEDALHQLLLQANADFKTDSNVYYIYEVQRRDLLKKYLTNVIIPFQYISSADFLKLLPPNLNSSNFFRLDDKGNKIVLSGSLEEIRPVWDFIKLIDQPSQGNSVVRIDLNYVKTDDVMPLLPPDLAGFNPQPLPGKTGILVSLPAAKKQDFLNFIAVVDSPTNITPIHLRFMKADDLMSKLPPSVTDTNVIRTNDQTLVFFRGSPALLQRFQKDLEQLDVPRPLLRYEILVMQFQEGHAENFSSGMTIQSGGKDHGFSGALGNLLNFNFDVVGNFGIGFGAQLNASITDNSARVVADTTLNGLSGEKISFQNTTSTYYAANEISTTGTATVVGSVNQLSSGLILGLEGWISSGNMVTLKVDATLSKQDTTSQASSSTSTTLPPNTDEKKLSTQVRMPSGQPLVIGGLKQDDNSSSVSKTPILGDIPLLNLLFQSNKPNFDHTEFTIYIVPILDKPDEKNLSEDDRLMLLYRRFQKDLR